MGLTYQTVRPCHRGWSGSHLKVQVEQKEALKDKPCSETILVPDIPRNSMMRSFGQWFEL
jgi:hypothetical protein